MGLVRLTESAKGTGFKIEQGEIGKGGKGKGVQKGIGGVGVVEVEGGEAREGGEETGGGREVEAEGEVEVRETGQTREEV